MLLIVGFVTAFLVEQKEIEKALEPFARWMHE